MWILVAYLTIGAVFILRDLSQPITNRPLYLGRRNTRISGMIYKVLLWPFFLHLSRRSCNQQASPPDLMTVDASEDVIDLYNQGTAASARGKFERAIQLFTQAIDRDPSFVPVYINRGNAYSKLKTPEFFSDSYEQQSDKAIADYSKAIQIDPMNGQAFYNRSIAKYVRGNHKDALSDIEHARSIGYTNIDGSIEEIIRRLVQANAEQR